MLLALAIAIGVLAVALAAILRPLLGADPGDAGLTAGELEREKLAKYRELSDLDLDWRTGKLSDDDYARTRDELRADAGELLARQRRARPPG